MKEYLNDIAWHNIFEKYDILAEVEKSNQFVISAEKIKPFREPRLMTKFDHAVNLPKIFSDNELSILPISRGNYIIAPFKTFHDFKTDILEDESITQLPLPDNLQSITYETPITSEAVALNIAAAAGIFSDFFEIKDQENDFLIPTVSGRMSSGTFDFQINSVAESTINVSVSNAQIEIDAAYESRDFLALFEAKNDLSDDFIIRQLFYPYRLWSNKITKSIRPVFLVYSNGIFQLREYIFEDPAKYNSLKIIKQKRYSLENTSISAEDIQSVLHETQTVPESGIPFPQADSFERVVNLCELIKVKDQPLAKDSITNQYAFDPRQTDYYTNAALYLGLLDKTKQDSSLVFTLSNTGSTLLQKKYKDRQLSFCKLILCHKAFHDALALYFNTGSLPTFDEIVSIMKNSNLYNISSDVTFKRRASTVSAWIKWIVGLINE